MRCEYVLWIQQDQDRIQWSGFVCTVMARPVAQEQEFYLLN
jgi:hypothetical protein